MKYLIVLTPTEAKKFIAKSLVRKHGAMKKALEEGIVLLHPSTSTFFIYEELVGKIPEDLRFIGAIAPKATCISREFEEIAAQRKKGFDQRDTTYSWVFKKGQLTKGVPLGECLNEMGPGDFYVKGVNVIDPDGSAGVLTANPDGGTITRAMTHAKQRKFDLLLIATSNKLINTSIEEASKATGRDKLDGAMGIPTSLFKVHGTLATEKEAFQWHGIKATPIAGGGLREAEGAFVYVLDGDEAAVKACLEVIGECKGARLEATFPDCEACRYERCNLSTVNQGISKGVLGIETLVTFLKSQKC
jgi:hypothetical protein